MARTRSQRPKTTTVDKRQAPTPASTRKSKRLCSKEKLELTKLKAAHKKEMDNAKKELARLKKSLDEKSASNTLLMRTLRNMSVDDRRSEIETWRKELLREVKEKEVLHKELKAKKNQMKAKDNEIFLLKAEMKEWNSLEDNQIVKKTLEKERAKTEIQRKRALESMAVLIKGQEDLEGQPKIWKFCEICGNEYGLTPARIPRVLDCGHTVCHECVTQLSSDPLFFRCPFDRTIINMDKRTFESLPKNFVVLQM